MVFEIIKIDSKATHLLQKKLALETPQPVLTKFELATPQNIADFYEDIKCCSTNALASSPAFLVAFWVVKATMTTVALYVSMTAVIVEPEGAELI